jgi:hypothetical protein
VDQQVVQAGWGDVVGERLERQAVVARGELELGRADRARAVDTGQLGAGVALDGRAGPYAWAFAARIAAFCARLPAW